ncbi:hypothetical protein HZA85_03985 [Candidatus Uhrbacteria bacterium]|nr:hypothetical protein [Candidatus Uhrbacteria bacterium]
MMSNAVKQFPQQFTFVPKVQNASHLKPFDQAFYIGMGGSHLAADLALLCHPKLPLSISSDYGLSAPIECVSRPLVIAGSYSGNTEETLDGYETARKHKLPVAVIASGGKLIDLAKKHHAPYIEIPNTGIQPRMALGFALRALLKLLGDERGLRDSARLVKTLKPLMYRKTGEHLAGRLRGKIPVIYSSTRNQAIAYNWKIKFNETGKIPAFFNVIPELNHNEMNGFDVTAATKKLCAPFHFIFLTDAQDHPRVQKRFAILERLYTKRGLPVERQPIVGKEPFEKVFRSLLTADWTAITIADAYGLESELVPMVEEFKGLMV